MDEKELERAAVEYLKRFPASSVHLERVLRRRIERRARKAGEGPEQARERAARASDSIERVVRRLTRAGLLDDDAYALGLCRSLHHRGKGERAIRARLREKGLAPASIDQALSRLAEEHDETPDLVAARAFARRRRLGPWRREPDPSRDLKDLAALARAGFSYTIARRVLDEEQP